MIHCSSYDEARFDLINLLSTDSYIKSAEIIFDENTKTFWIDYEVFDSEECDKII